MSLAGRVMSAATAYQVCQYHYYYSIVAVSIAILLHTGTKVVDHDVKALWVICAKCQLSQAGVVLHGLAFLPHHPGIVDIQQPCALMWTLASIGWSVAYLKL